MQVPTTQTFSSRHKESKDLADHNALLIQEKEILHREVKELIKAKEEIIRKSGYTPAEYAKVEKEHLSRIEDMENRAVKARIELGRLEKAVDDRRASLTQLSTRNESLRGEKKVLERDVEVLSKRRAEAEGSTAEATLKYSELINDKSKELSTLTKKTETIKNARAVVSGEIEQRMKSVIEQERLLVIRRNDLEIYEARLRNKYHNEVITL